MVLCSTDKAAGSMRFDTFKTEMRNGQTHAQTDR